MVSRVIFLLLFYVLILLPEMWTFFVIVFLGGYLIGANVVRWNLPESPWLDIAENVLEDLLASFENVRKEMDHKLEQVQPNLVARVGKVLFHRLVQEQPKHVILYCT